MEYERIIYKPGKVTRIIMNRPRYMNAISHPMYKEMEEAFDHATNDEECRVIVLSGEGRCFSAGQDVNSPEGGGMVADGTTHEELVNKLGSEEAATSYFIEEHAYYAYEMKIRKWRNIPKPTIAMVHGECIFGGFFNAASMDLIFASEDALFLPPIGQFNVGWDLSIRKSKELLFEHRLITAREAYENGLVSRIYPDREILEKETLDYAQRVADNAVPTYIGDCKKALNLVMDISGFPTAMDYAFEMSWKMHKKGAYSDSEMQTWRSEKGFARVPLALDNLKKKQESDQKYYG